MTPGDTLLEVRDIVVRFGGLVALQKVNLTVGQGEVVGIIGPNGAGKSTLFNSINGLTTVVEGSIIYRGQDITKWPMHRIAQAGIARVFQHTKAFMDHTVRENLTLAGIIKGPQDDAVAKLVGKRGVDHDEVDRVLTMMGLAAHQHEIVRELPYGTQRKVAIALTVIRRPELLLLDEPAVGLNPSETADLAQSIMSICRELDTTVMVIEHDMDMVLQLCSRIMVLNFGEVLIDGAAQAVLSHETVIQAYLGGDN